MAKRISHRLLTLTGIGLVGLLCLLALLHTAPVRSRVLAGAIDRLRTDVGIEAEIEQLDYNLFALRLAARNATLAIPGADPFLLVDAIRIDLPWSIVSGQIAIESLEVDRPRLVVARSDDGTLNLPGALPADEPAAVPESSVDPIEIGRLVIRELSVGYDDGSVGVSVDGRDVSLDMAQDAAAQLAGRLTMSGGLTIQAAGRQTALSRLAGNLAFDGSTLYLDQLAVAAPEGELMLDGRIDLLAAVPRVELQYEGRASLAAVESWTASDRPMNGDVTFAGEASGEFDALRLSIALSGNELVWGDERNVSIDLRASLSPEAAEIESATLAAAGGQVLASGHIEFGDQGSSRAEAQWKGLDVGALALAVSPEVNQILRVGTIADGEMAVTWTGTDLLGSANGRADLHLTAKRGGPLALPLSGEARATLDVGRWGVELRPLSVGGARVAGRVDGVLDASDLLATTVAGQIDLDTGELSDLLARIRQGGVDVSALEGMVAGQLTASAMLAGTFGAPTASGSIEGRHLTVADVGPGIASGRFSASPSAVAIDALRFEIGSNVVVGDLSFDLDAGTLDAAVTAELPRVASFATALPAEWRPEGTAQLEAKVSGAFENPSAQAVLSAVRLDVAGQTVGPVDAVVQLADRVVVVERFDLAQDEGRLSLTGSYSLDSGRYDVEGTGRGLAVRPIVASPPSDATSEVEGEIAPLPIEARFDFGVSGEGTSEAPAGRAFVDITSVAWGAYDLGRARIDLQVEEGEARLVASVPAVHATIEEVLGLESRQFTTEAAVDSADLTTLLRAGGPVGEPEVAESAPEALPFSGAAVARVTAFGSLDNLAAVTAALDLSLIDTTVGDAAIRLDRAARFRYGAGTIVADDVALRIGGTSLSAAGRLGAPVSDGEPLTVAINGSLGDLVPLFRLVPGLELTDATGRVDLSVQVAGPLAEPEVSGTLVIAGGAFGAAELPPAEQIEVDASFDDGLLTLRDLRATWQGATLSASGTVPATLFGAGLPEGYLQRLPALPDRARASVSVDSLTPAALSPFLDADTVGRLEGVLALSATLEATSLEVSGVTGDLAFSRAELSMAGVPLSQQRQTRLRLAEGRLKVVDWAWAGAGNQLNIRGQVQLDGETPRLDVALDGTLDLRMLGAFVPDIATRGRATFLVQATGPANELAVDGEIVVSQGEIAIRDPRIAVTELEGRVALTADHLELVDVQAEVNGGTLALTGALNYPGFSLEGGAINLAGRGIALEVPVGLRSEVDVDLALALSEAPELTGSVTVLRGSYREPISLVGQLLTQVDVQPVTPEASVGSPEAIRLSIGVVSEDNIVVDNNYGRLEIESGLRVTGTTAQPSLAGRLTIGEGGSVFLAGQTWRVERGSTDFVSATGIEPNFDLALVTRVQRYDVRLTVRGTPDTLEANLTSPDGLSQADAVSLLLSGRLADESSAAQADVARGQLVMLLSGELLGFAGRAVGLDSAQVSRGLGGAASDFDLILADTDPSTRLTVSKQLRRDVEVIFSQNLRETGDLTWIAVYRPRRAIELRATTAASDVRSYEFRSELTFGGGAPRARQSGGIERVDPRVSAVCFTGAPEVEERQLRGVLRVGSGDRFDFYRWMEDRDRLARYYHERGYLEAAIRATRQSESLSSGEPGIVLEYAVDRGAATTLVIEGARLPGRLVDDMRTRWSQAVFDGFLLEDLGLMAKRELLAEGYLQAATTAIVRDGADPGQKTIVVTVTPGPRFTERHLVFQGQRSRSAAELAEVVEAAGLNLTVWLQPAEVEASLARYFRALGYLSAVVSLEAPEFRGEVASRVVRVSEGPRAQVTDVAVAGANVKSEGEVRRLFGIEASDPYDPFALEPARRAVELAYLREGYNDVHVGVVGLVDEQARVALTLNLDEGRQQILEQVSVTGSVVTSDRTIERALDLGIGRPLELSDTYRAQKRLYDTGVFQRADIELVAIEGERADGAQPVRATVTVQEVPLYRFRYGFRVGDEPEPLELGRTFKPGFVVDLLRRNLFGAAVTTGVVGQIETDRRLVRGILSTPRFFGLPVTSSLYVTRSRQDFASDGPGSAFIEDTSDFTVEQRFRVRSSAVVSYNYRFKRSHVFQTAEPLPGLPVLDSLFDVARLTGAFAWDTRDDPFDAQRGWFYSSGIEYAPAALGSDLRFVKYVLQQYYFRPVAGGLVLASGFRLGAARGFDQALIPSERFFVGGGDSVRGFGEGAIGGVDFFGDPLGGSSSLIVNQEVRFRVFRWVRGVGFFDAGNVFPRIRDLDLFGLESAVGAGLRIETPFGLVRIDYGMPLTNRSGEPFGRWYFSLGQAF